MMDRQMANVVLNVDEATSGDLPLVCMRCGEAARLVSKNHLYYWVHRVDLQCPLCDVHKNHLKWRTGWLAAAFPLSVLVALIAMILLGLVGSALLPPIHVEPIVLPFLFFGSVIAC